MAWIKTMFSSEQNRRRLDHVKRLGVAGQILTDQQFEFFREQSFFDDDPVRGAKQILPLARARELLL